MISRKKGLTYAKDRRVVEFRHFYWRKNACAQILLNALRYEKNVQYSIWPNGFLIIKMENI